MLDGGLEVLERRVGVPPFGEGAAETGVGRGQSRRVGLRVGFEAREDRFERQDRIVHAAFREQRLRLLDLPVHVARTRGDGEREERYGEEGEEPPHRLPPGTEARYHVSIESASWARSTSVPSTRGRRVSPARRASASERARRSAGSGLAR